MAFAKLRVCASCEWVFEASDEKHAGCPKCQFGSYGAYRTYGNSAYRYAVNQKKWLDKKLFSYESKLLKEINETPAARKALAAKENQKNISKTYVMW